MRAWEREGYREARLPHASPSVQLPGRLVERIEQKPGCRARRSRVLAGDQLTVDDRVNAPVLDLGKGGAELHEFVLDEEWHHLGQLHLFFLAIGEAGHGFAFDE